MSKTCYTPKKFKAESLRIIEIADNIITDYAARGYDLTLRQLYYQFVSKDIVENTERSYKRLGNIIGDARLAGLIDWASLKDRTRGSRCVTTYYNPSQILRQAARDYSQKVWDKQPCYVEVWVEKEALSQVVSHAACEFYVPFLSCKGYVSLSAMYESAQRFESESFGRPCHLIHLGDHDPSGIDMTRDIGARLSTFGVEVNIHRIALNMNQVEQYQPPPNPAKITDSRAKDYIARYGRSSWELDALRPELLESLIKDEIESLMDEEAYQEAINKEGDYCRRLKEIARNFEESE